MRRLAAFALLLALTAPAAADYPDKPVRLIIPFPPGGSNDVVGRLVANQLSENLGHKVYVDNRGGAATVIGAELAAHAPGDGYTLLVATITTLAVNPALNKKLPYDPERDFTPVSLLTSAPLVLVVHPSLPVKSVRELIALARAKPGAMTYATSGVGTALHTAGLLMESLAGIRMTAVHYRGAAPALKMLCAPPGAGVGVGDGLGVALGVGVGLVPPPEPYS